MVIKENNGKYRNPRAFLLADTAPGGWLLRQDGNICTSAWIVNLVEEAALLPQAPGCAASTLTHCRVSFEIKTILPYLTLGTSGLNLPMESSV